MNSRYELVSKINSSLYGEIYLAKDKLEGNQVVVKLSALPNTTSRENSLEDPSSEVSILQKLRDVKERNNEGHRFIIGLMEAFPVEFDNSAYLCTVLEHASGGDMLDKIVWMDDRKKKMSFRRIKKYALMMAKGVAFIHKHGIAHLDLSLENMLLTSEDEIRICDFGQAQQNRLFRAFSPRRGKLTYMAPEIYCFHPYDGYKADVWSLGVIFWSMLSNGSLYDKPVPADPHFAYVQKGKEGLQQLFEGSEVNDIPPQCLDLLSHMLDLYPHSRYTIEEVLAHPWMQPEKKIRKTNHGKKTGKKPMKKATTGTSSRKNLKNGMKKQTLSKPPKKDDKEIISLIGNGGGCNSSPDSSPLGSSPPSILSSADPHPDEKHSELITLSHGSGGCYASTIFSSTLSRNSPSRFSSENSSVFSSSRSAEEILSSIDKLETGMNGMGLVNSGSSSPTQELNQSTYSVTSTSTEIVVQQDTTERPHSYSSLSRCRSQ
jgi:serine/threonine protein kinase